MENKDYLKIGLVYVVVFILSSIINIYNGYSFSKFFTSTLLSVAIYVTIAFICMWLFKKLNDFVKIPLIYVVMFLITILLNVVQGYTYDQYIKSVVWGTIMFGTMSVGMIYSLGLNKS